MEMIQPRIKLDIAKDIPEDPGVVATKNMPIREQPIQFSLGACHQNTQVIPGGSILQIDITETDSNLMVLVDAVGVTTWGDAA